MAKNVKKKIVRQVLGHPFQGQAPTPLDALTQEIHQLVSQTFSHVFPPNPSKEDLLTTMALPAEVHPREKCRLLRVERQKLRSLPTQNMALKSHLSVGLKKCLRDLTRGQIELVLFDPVALPDPVQTLLLTYGQVKVTAVKRLMKLTHDTFGFSASIVGLSQLSGQSLLRPWAELCQKLPQSQLGPSETSQPTEVPPPANELVEESEPIVEASSDLLLKRTNLERVFKPPAVPQPKKKKLSEFGSDFIGFEVNAKKRKTNYHKTNLIKAPQNVRK